MIKAAGFQKLETAKVEVSGETLALIVRRNRLSALLSDTRDNFLVNHVLGMSDCDINNGRRYGKPGSYPNSNGQGRHGQQIVPRPAK